MEGGRESRGGEERMNETREGEEGEDIVEEEGRNQTGGESVWQKRRGRGQ